MKTSVPGIRAATVLTVTVLILTSGLSSQVKLGGRVFRGSVGTGETPIKINISGFSTPEEILNLKQLMISNEMGKFYKVLRAMDKARVTMPAGDINARFNIAVEERTDEGIRILLATESRIIKQGSRFGGPYYFQVVELNLNQNYEGDGKIHDAASLSFLPQGGIALDTYRTVPDQISNIRKTK